MVGLASGVTAGSAVSHEQVKTVDAVDLIQIDAGSDALFHNVEQQRPCKSEISIYRRRCAQLRTLYGQTLRRDHFRAKQSLDGRHRIPFFTEYYSDIRKILKPSGLFLQWVQIYEISDPTFVAVLRTLHTSFPFIYGFQGAARDLLLLGTSSP